MKMRAAIYHRIQDVRLEEVEIPQINLDEVLVKIKAALTCGTDRKMYLRGYHLVNPPFVFGHEFAGDIVKVGANVKNFKEGMRVVAANSAPCNKCFYCKIGRESLCENLTFRLSGAFAEYVKIPRVIVEQNLLEIPSNVSYKEAALVEPLACVVHGIEESNIRLGDIVVVNGTGPIGLMHVRLAKLKGAKVIATDLNKKRLELARKLGADKTIDASKVDQVKAVRQLTENKRGVDVAIEAVGLPEVWERTIAMVRKGGTVNLFGGPPSGTKVTIDTKLLHYSEVTIKGVFHHTPQYVKRALNLISQKALDADFLISHELPLSEFSKILEMMVNHKGVKIAVIP